MRQAIIVRASSYRKNPHLSRPVLSQYMCVIKTSLWVFLIIFHQNESADAREKWRHILQDWIVSHIARVLIKKKKKIIYKQDERYIDPDFHTVETDDFIVVTIRPTCDVKCFLWSHIRAHTHIFFFCSLFYIEARTSSSLY